MWLSTGFTLNCTLEVVHSCDSLDASVSTAAVAGWQRETPPGRGRRAADGLTCAGRCCERAAFKFCPTARLPLSSEGLNLARAGVWRVLVAAACVLAHAGGWRSFFSASCRPLSTPLGSLPFPYRHVGTAVSSCHSSSLQFPLKNWKGFWRGWRWSEDAAAAVWKAEGRSNS